MFLSPASSFLIKVLLGIVLLPKSRYGPTLCKLLHNVGCYRLIGNGKIPKSKLIQKLDSGNRDIYKEYVSFRCYRGKVIPSIERRRKEEFELFYIP